MAEQDSEYPHELNGDEFDIEITDLDAVEGAEKREWGEAAAEIERAGKSEEPVRRGRSGLRARWTRRQRVLQVMVTTMIALLLLSAFLNSSASMRSVIIGLLRPTPTPQPPVESDSFYVQGNPSWGQLFIDGHRVAHLPLVGVEAPLRLQRGVHVLRWQASPFDTQSCTVSVPGWLGVNTCLAQAVPVNEKVSAWLITFAVSLANLPPTQRAALTRTAQAALDAMRSTDTVQPGELYAVSLSEACKPEQRVTYCFATAQEPLKATLHFALDTQMSAGATTCISAGLGNTCIFQQQDCHLFCAFPAQLFHVSSSSSSPGWNVFVVVRSSWTYALPDGHVIARNQPNSFLDFEQGDEYFVAMHITWNGAKWQVAVLPGQLLSNPVCTEAQNEVEIGGFLARSNISFPLTWNFAANATLAAGCLAVASATQQTNTTPLPSTYPVPGAYCLQRFGVLLAANATAHRYWPYLPLADHYEQGMAQHLAIQLAENL
ncbi:MAG TPA: hypothetical protein VKV40_07715 [Ktedonobacteraceae bacterium]|nr:hypothetical protein [Ktedonobacteraceae bacterium]